MEVGEIFWRSAGAVKRFAVRSELNEVATDEPGGQADAAQDLAQQPGGIAAGAFSGFESLLRSLDARLEADNVLDVVLEFAVERDEKIYAARFAAGRGGAGDLSVGRDPRLTVRRCTPLAGRPGPLPSLPSAVPPRPTL